jgi:hypothetical protein
MKPLIDDKRFVVKLDFSISPRIAQNWFELVMFYLKLSVKYTPGKIIF